MKKNNLPGIAVFGYNRPKHFEKTLYYLKKNLNSEKFDIFLFCDGSKKKNDLKVKGVHKIAKKLKHFKSKKIFLRKKNLGLANSLLDGITTVFKFKKSVIVLEDDIVTNKYFLNYMSDGLEFHEKNKLVGSVTGYSYTNTQKYSENLTYLSQRHASWGWGTWKHLWKKMYWDRKMIQKKIKQKNFRDEFNLSGNDMYPMLLEVLENKLDTLDILFNFNCFILNKYSVCPKKSLIYNIGLDGSGIHCKKGDKVFNNYSKNFRVNKFSKPYVNKKILKQIKNSFKTPIFLRITNKVKKILL